MKYTKAQMLIHLKDNLEQINILPVMIVLSDDFLNETEETINKIIKFADGQPLIIRSSSTAEDNAEYSNAGKFESVLNVLPEAESIKMAVQKVYSSYETESVEEILIQPMLNDISKSGVVFTEDMDTGADYYIVNYHEGKDTAAVTSGNSNELKTFISYKNTEFEIENPDMKLLLEYCGLIEGFLQRPALDIEFAITAVGEVYILQVRDIAKGNKSKYVKQDLDVSLKRIYKKIKKLSCKHPFLLGDTTYFGVMPDWNPAEILGVRPKKLAISLYKELITDSIWAHQRYNYGYRNLTMTPLMVSFCGIPYIDTRIMFNSFIPQKLNDKIAEKLVNYYLDKLARYPKYHDKVEFEIVYSCYYFGISEKMQELTEYGFNQNEIKRIEFALLDLTNSVINPVSGLYKKDIEKIEKLEEDYNEIINSNISNIDKIYWLIEVCKEYGTLPFAGVARAAFIAVQFLKSLVNTGIINQSTYDQYMGSMDTINRKMNCDLSKYYAGEFTKEEFVEKYGHIRPGTYDILSPRYDEDFDEYFGKGMQLKYNDSGEKFAFSKETLSRIQEELEENGLLINSEELLCFFKSAIEGREYLKFVFTKCISKILQLIENVGNRAEIEKEDLAYLDISVIKQLYVDLYAGDVREIFMQNIQNNKKQHENAVQLKLPSIIIEPKSVYSFYLLKEEPNFITQKNITADVVCIKDKDQDYCGKIVLIQAADPGYDFLFSKKIAGLITQFGGANSHMAIRCAELGIPAVIGVGENNYKEWGSYKRMTIDCQKKQVLKIT